MNGATIGRRLSAKASASLRLASACLALPIGRRRSASLSPRRHAWDNVPFGLPDGFDFAAIKKTPSSAFDVLLKRTRGIFETLGGRALLTTRQSGSRFWFLHERLRSIC